MKRCLGTVPDLTGGDPLGPRWGLKERLRTILLSVGAGPHVSPTLAGFGLERFAPVNYEHYASEEQALRECERALGTRLR